MNPALLVIIILIVIFFWCLEYELTKKERQQRWNYLLQEELRKDKEKE